MKKRSLASLALAAVLAATILPAAPALADGAASTRNIILGGAAAAGALILINHNKQVHAREAQMAQNQADSAAAAQNAQAAYASEHRAYMHEVAINQQYQREVAIQHNMIVSMRGQLAQTQPATNAGGAPTRVAAARTVSYGWGAL